MNEDKTLKDLERSARGGTAVRRSATDAAALLDQRIAGQRSDSIGSDDSKAKSKAHATASVSTVKLEPPSRSSKKNTSQTTMEASERGNSNPRRAMPSPTGSRTGLSELESDALSKSNARDAEPAVTVARTMLVKEDPALKKIQGAQTTSKTSTAGAEAVRGLDERIAYKTGIVTDNDGGETEQAPPPVQPVTFDEEEDPTGETLEKHFVSAERLAKMAGLPPDSIGAALEKDQNDKLDCILDDVLPESFPYGDLEGGDDAANKLAVAVAVKEDEDDAYIPAAVEYDPDAKPPLYRNRRFRLYSLLACTLIVVMIAGVVGLLSQQKKEAPDQDEAATTAPTRPGSSGILEQLELIVGSEVLNDPEGAHYLAKEWIINEDPLQLSPEDSNLVQRYLLAVIYFKLHEEGDWLSCNAPTEDEPDDFCLFQKLINIYPREYRSIAWYRWLSANHECSWAGIFCDEFFQLRTIDLAGQDIVGTLPTEMTYFPFLQGIGLAWNKIHGTLPIEYGEMPHLLNFELHYNQLTGSIPREWARAKNLQLFNVASNEISGALPSDFGAMSNLKGLFLFENILTGTFPSELGQLSLLTYIRLQRNFFTGTLPSEIGLLSPREFWSHRMPIEGPLPPEIGNMGDILDLRFNGASINGTLPEELWQLTKLFRLDLFNTGISGTLSPNVAKLTDLVFLRLRSTDMSGAIPTEIVRLTELNRLWLDANDFTGSVPDELCDLPALVEITADCLSSSDGGDPRVNCTCCNFCCDHTTGLCDEV